MLENTLLKNNELQRVIIEHIQDGIFVIESGRFEYCNSIFSDLLGSTPIEVIGLTLADVLSKEDCNTLEERYQKRLNGEDVPTIVEFDLERLSDAMPIHVLCSIGIAKTDDGKIRSVGTLKDITEIHRMTNDLRRSERESRDIINRFSATYYRTDKNGIYTYITPYCAVDIGYEPSELIGTDITSVYYSQADRGLVLSALENNKGKPTYVEARIKHKNGAIVWAATHAQYYYDKDGLFAGVEGTTRNITEKKLMEEHLQEMVVHDQLTGLLNRSGLYAQMEHALSTAERNESQLCLYFIDLDKFKHINDQHGHKAGDLTLIEVGRRLRENRRNMDIVARLGGDEFIVVLEITGGIEQAVELGTIIRDNVSRPYLKNNDINCSLGFAMFPDDGADIDSLMCFADKKLYAQKKTAD